MDARTRRRAVAVSAVLALAVGALVTALPPRPAADTAGSSPAATQATSKDTAPTVVPDRYLLPAADARARRALLAAIKDAGATVDRTYATTWKGFAVTATDEQLRRITAAAAVPEVYPVYQLSLDDPAHPDSTRTTDETGTTSDDPTPAAEAEPSAEASPSPSTAGAGEAGAPADDLPSGPVAVADEKHVEYLVPAHLAVLANDTQGTDATLVADSLVLTGPGVEADGKRLAIAGRGTFTVTADGHVDFVSAPGWAGTLDPVGYSVADSSGATASATLTVIVDAPAAPVAVDDAGSATTGRAVAVDVLRNDSASGAATLQAGALCLLAADSCEPTSSTDEGVWAAGAGALTFTPADGFVGTATTRYRVSDDLGRSATATVRVAIHAAPTASDRTASTGYATPVTIGVLDQTVPGGATVDPGTLVLLDADDTAARTLEVPGEGRWTVTDDGGVTFSPAHGFVGEAIARYRFTDADGASAGARLIVTVGAPAAPAAVADSAHTVTASPITVDVLANDSGAGLDAGSVCLRTGDGCVASVTDAAGTWAVAEGGVRFSPAPGFLGTATITYQVSDELGATASAAVSISVTDPPVAADDAAHTPHQVPVTVPVLSNDVPGCDHDGPGTLDPGSVRLANGTRDLDTPAGHFSVVESTGAITVTPAPGFTGVATTSYTVRDSFGSDATGTLSVRVGAGPSATADTAGTRQHLPVTLSVLDNDEPGDDGDSPARPVPLDPASTVLVGETIGTTVTTAEGTWTVDGGLVTFTPTASFSGAAAIGYRVADANANTATGTVTVTVSAIVPTAAPDATGVPAQHTASVVVLANDAPGDDSAPLVPSSVRFTAPGASTDGRTLTTDDGTWTADADGIVRFAPEDSFSGATSSTTYSVADTNGTTATALVSVRVGALTTARDFAASTEQNVTLTTDPLSLVSVGDDGYGAAGTLRTDTMAFTGEGTLDGGRELVTQGEGTWRIDATGDVTFDPESAFTGTASAGYEITDSFGNTVEATIRVLVSAIVPQLEGDSSHTPANHSVTVNVLANDRAGAGSAPLKPASLELVSTDPAAGTWRVNADQTLTFTPATDATGPTSAQYRVRDANNTPGTATVQVMVGALPTGVDDTATTPQDGATFTLQPLANDLAGDDGTGTRTTFRAGSLVLTSPDAAPGGTSLTTPGYTWTVTADNQVAFTADWRFTGTASVDYRATDAYGNPATATITVTVEPTAPTDTERRLAAIGALGVNAGGAGVKVGIIDSGVNFTHPDLGGTADSTFPTSRVAAGYDFVDDDAVPSDCTGHGTHVAGIVAADGNPKLQGAFGVAPKATLGAYRVFNCNGDATTDDILAALDRAYTDGMNVVNLSLGASAVSWPSESGYPLTQAAAKLVAKGVVVVASAGNSERGPFTVGSPAVAAGVISVAASDPDGAKIEGYSATGPAADLSLSPTLSAPGSSVLSTWLGTSRKDASGTSMAAPEVAGAAAELLRARGWTTPRAGVPAKVAALLYGSATPVNTRQPGLESRLDSVVRQGAGLLQLESALAAPTIATPSTLRLGEGSSHTVTVTLENSRNSAISYAVSGLSAVSVAPSTGTSTDVGNQTPEWVYGTVGLTARPATVTVPAGGTARVAVTITAPSKVLYGRQGLLYGGWVRFTAADAPTVSVPFLGLRGDYQKVKLLPSANRSFTDASSGISYTVKLPALAYRTSDSVVTPTYSGTRTFYVARHNGQPYVMFHLDYPTSGIRVKAVNQRTKKSYYAVLSGTNIQLGPRGRDESYTLVPFYGVAKVSGRLVRVPAGTYKLQLRVLKPLGNASYSSHWETWTTRSLVISWK